MPVFAVYSTVRRQPSDFHTENSRLRMTHPGPDSDPPGSVPVPEPGQPSERDADLQATGFDAGSAVVGEATPETDSPAPGPDLFASPGTDIPRGQALPDTATNRALSAGTNPQVGGDPDAAPQFLWLRRTDQLFIGVMLGAIVILLTIHALRLSRWGRSPIEIERLPESQYAYRLDINEATWVEWAQLDGIGEVLAQRIVADRTAHGPFQTVQDLQRVKGIGPKILERIRPVLEVRKPQENPH